MFSHISARKLSIRQLLGYWAIGCIALILVMVLTNIYTNQSIKNNQDLLANIIIPVEVYSRRIDKTMSDFISRNANILSTKTLDEFQYYLNRHEYENNFEESYDQLFALTSFDSNTNTILSMLKNRYEKFIIYDEDITNNKKEILLIEDTLNKKYKIQGNLVKDIFHILDEVSGIMQLQTSYIWRDIRNNILSDGLSITAQHNIINNKLLYRHIKTQNSINIINQDIRIITYLSKDIMHETNKDNLINLKENQIIQYWDIIKNTSLSLKANLAHKPDLLKKIKNLDSRMNELMEVLIYQESSIFALRLQYIRLEDRLRKNIRLTDDSINMLLEQLKQLSNSVNMLTQHSVFETQRLSRYNLTIIAIVSLAVILVMLFGIRLLIHRINIPLRKVRSAMNALSKGDLTTRLAQSSFAEDEFLSLSVDFNRFAENNNIAIKDLSNAKNALEESEGTTKAMLENALVGIAHLKDRRIISVNHKFEDIFGYDRDEILGESTKILFPNIENFEEVGVNAYALLENRETYQSEWEVVKKDGSIFWCAISAKSIIDGNPAHGTIWLYEDITHKKHSENKLKQLANYDTLTKLPNRTLFMDRLEHSLNLSKRNQEPFAVLFIDLDRFKQVNDSLGHSAGDELLQHVAQRLKHCVREADTVARLGGDEFTVLLNNFKDSNETCTKIASNIIRSLSHPINILDQEVNTSPSIGISVYPEDGHDISTLLKNADAAMYFAKSEGRNNFQFYTQTMNAEALYRLTIENKLRRAVENNELMVYYQPKVLIGNRKVIGYEALMRWHDQDMGMIPPDKFIPVLEDIGLINQAGNFILEKACGDIKKLNETLSEKRTIAVNLSARQFLHNDLVSQIKNILKKTKLESKYLELEITETVMMTNSEQSQSMLSDLSRMGIKISLDDFGTGYSSLAYLKRFPINTLKIDRSFVRDLLTDPSDAAICEAILAMAHRLDIEVVAEGVETEEQLEFLIEQKCHIVQGYLFGPPTPLQLSNDRKPSVKLAD